MKTEEKVEAWQQDWANEGDDLTSLCERASELLGDGEAVELCELRDMIFARIEDLRHGSEAAGVIASRWAIELNKIRKPLYLHAAPQRERDSPEAMDCPYAKSDMTPCVRRDGELAVALTATDERICVGCERLLQDQSTQRERDSEALAFKKAADWLDMAQITQYAGEDSFHLGVVRAIETLRKHADAILGLQEKGE